MLVSLSLGRGGPCPVTIPLESKHLRYRTIGHTPRRGREDRSSTVMDHARVKSQNCSSVTVGLRRGESGPVVHTHCRQRRPLRSEGCSSFLISVDPYRRASLAAVLNCHDTARNAPKLCERRLFDRYLAVGSLSWVVGLPNRMRCPGIR